MNSKLISFVCVLALASASYGVVIGDWEDANDGWIDWGNGKLVDDPCNMPSKYNYSADWSSLNDKSLKLTQSGWNQNLAIKLQDNGLVDEFMANTKFLIDVHVPASDQSGWSKIEEVVLNGQGADWGDYLWDDPAFFGWGEGGGDAQTATLELDYSAYLSDPDVVSLGHDPWWVEIVFCTNSDEAHPVFYFDNARLVPEPMTIALLGLGGLALRRRKR